MIPSFGSKRSWTHRAIAIIVLGVFVAGLFPLPMPRLSPLHIDEPSQKDAPYPCQGGTCGCDSAEKCWTSCCCHTPEERHAWAIDRGIKPPSYAVLTSNHNRLSKGSEAKSCCLTKSRSKVESSQPDACCSKRSEPVLCEEVRSRMAEQPPRLARLVTKRGWVDSISAARCRGFGYDLSGGTYFVAPHACCWSERTALTETMGSEPYLYASIPLSIDLPPPRTVLLSIA